jgi:hypothetical protein
VAPTSLLCFCASDFASAAASFALAALDASTYSFDTAIAARAKEAAADAKSLAQKQSKDVGATGSADYGAHAVLDDTLHQDRKQKI